MGLLGYNFGLQQVTSSSTPQVYDAAPIKLHPFQYTATPGITRILALADTKRTEHPSIMGGTKTTQTSADLATYGCSIGV